MLEFQPLLAVKFLTDQEKPVRYLSAILDRGSIPSALLFTGIQGVGKKIAATAFAMACNCITAMNSESMVFETENSNTIDSPTGIVPCGSCRACRKILSGNHPDILTINPHRNLIKISQIRTLCQRLAVKPHEGRLRVVMIHDASAMNQEAGNALLKVLEEPPERTLMVLTTRQKTDLLPTIVSRCMQIRFNPVSVATLEAQLMEENQLPQAEAMVLARMAGGNLDRTGADRMSSWINHRNWLIDILEKIPEMPTGLLLSFAEMLASKKEDLVTSLEAIKIWFRDLYVYPHAPEMVVNQDLTEKIRRSVSRFSTAALIANVDAVTADERSLERNCNPRLTLEKMILQIAKS